MSGTKIEYMNVGAKKGETWSPWIGCSPVSPGCKNCWARREEDGRFRRLGRCRGVIPPKGKPYFFRGPIYQGDRLMLKPLGWRKPRQVFVGSRCDIFHDDIPFEQLDRLWAVMALCPQHTFQCLTKRPQRMLEYLSDWDRVTDGIANTWVDDMVGPTMGTIDINNAWCRAHGISPAEEERRNDIRTDFYCGWHQKSSKTLVDASKHMWPIPNVWLGVTVEDQQRADERIPLLLKCPAALRYVSYEPALGPVDFERWMFANDACDDGAKTPSGRIGWLIVGGESGKGARPMHPSYARQARDQCAEAGVPFFFKQWSEWTLYEHLRSTVGSIRTGREQYFWRPVGAGGMFDESYKAIAQGRPIDEAENGRIWIRVGKKAAGRLLDGKLHDAMPEVPA